MSLGYTKSTVAVLVLGGIGMLIVVGGLLLPNHHPPPIDAAVKQFLEFKAKAEKGEAEAQFNLSLCYRDGRGAEPGYTEMHKWLRKSAEQNFLPAQCELGKVYQGSSDVNTFSETVKWYRQAAEQNYPKGQHGLGVCYQRGIGVKKDNLEAAKWFRKAAEQNYLPAQNTLGDCYREGNGVEQNPVEAAKWYRQAAEQDFLVAQYNLALCYLKGEGVANDVVEAYAWYFLVESGFRKFSPQRTSYGRLANLMSPEQIATGKQRAKELRMQIAAKLKSGAK